MGQSNVIVAVTSNLAAMGTDSPTFRQMASHDWWTADGANCILVLRSYTQSFAQVSAYLTAAGCVVPPSHKDHSSQVGAAFANHAAIPKAAGVVPSDTTWQACQKIAGTGWIAIDPTDF